MKVLVVSNLYPPAVLGGYEVECQVVVDALRARGDEVTVLTGDRDAGKIPPERGVRRELAFLTRDASGSLRAPLAALRGARIMRKTLDELQPDLVWVWNGAQLPQAALVTALRSPFTVAFRVCEAWFGELWHTDQFLRHLYRTDRGGRRVWAMALRALNRSSALQIDVHERHAAHVVWNSRALRAHAQVPPAIDALSEEVIHTTAAHGPLFAAAERKPRTPASPVVIAFVGRAERAKGVDVAVDAIIALNCRHEIAATLVVAGAADAKERRASERRVAAAGLPSSTLRWLGVVSPDTIAQLFEVASATLIVPVEFDAFPQVCIEAAYARVPVVGSNVGGIPECLHPDEHALIVPRGDSVATAAAVVQILTDRQSSAARVERARLRAESLSLGAYLDASKAYIDRVLGAPCLDGATQRKP